MSHLASSVYQSRSSCLTIQTLTWKSVNCILTSAAFVARSSGESKMLLKRSKLTPRLFTIGPRYGRFSPSFCLSRRTVSRSISVPGFHLCPNWICHHTIDCRLAVGVKFTDSFRSTNIHLKEVEKPARASYLSRKRRANSEQIQLGQFYRSCSSVKVGGCWRLRNLSLVVGRRPHLSYVTSAFRFVEFQMAWCDAHPSTVIPDHGFSSSNKSCGYPCEIYLNWRAYQQKLGTSQSYTLP
jgi:hypothetical protein